jgi:hypothetical protein
MIEGKEIFGAYDEYGDWGVKCPYEPGMRLWVRETWRHSMHADHSDCYCYRADNATKCGGICLTDDFIKWKPSIFMPRCASRITLEVTDVRIERLQSITEDDARAEGVQIPVDTKGNWFQRVDGIYVPKAPTFREHFRLLWDELNFKRGYGWEVNPWVWVVSFKRLEVSVNDTERKQDAP